MAVGHCWVNAFTRHSTVTRILPVTPHQRSALSSGEGSQGEETRDSPQTHSGTYCEQEASCVLSHFDLLPDLARCCARPLRAQASHPTSSIPISSRVSNLELMATWSLPRPMICGEQETSRSAKSSNPAC